MRSGDEDENGLRFVPEELADSHRLIPQEPFSDRRGIVARAEPDHFGWGPFLQAIS